jgi:ribosome-binding factor A
MGNRHRERDTLQEHGGHRHARLQQILFEELTALIRDELNDPALGNVRVVEVDLSIDYRSARVKFILEGQADPRLSERALERATPLLRSRVGEALDIKRAPALRFVHDQQMEAAQRAARLLDGDDPCTR